MAQTATANLSNLFTDLHRLGQSGEYERALKVANKILQEKPDDGKAFHCRVVCFIQLGKFEEALSAIKKKPQLASGLAFEKGYCEYRLNRTKEALNTLRAVQEPENRVKELLGQVLYRLEEYGECFETYKDLLKNTQDDFEEERETNLSAVMAALQMWSDQEIDAFELREDTYELCYNAACSQLGNGLYQEAIDKLKKAEELCRAAFADDPDATEEDVDAELGIIRIQRAYALQMLHRTEEASHLYYQVIKQKLSDVALAAVASNNIVTVNKEQNVFDSKKKMKTATADGLRQKLTAQQQEVIAMNQCLLYMYSNQGEQCKKTAAVLRKQYPGSPKPSLIEAAQYCRDKQLAKAVQVLQKQLESKESKSLQLQLTLAQLHLAQGQVFKACEILQDLGDCSCKLGVVSALVSLYLSQEDQDGAARVLNDAVSWYAKNEPKSAGYVTLMRANANFQLRHGSPQVATQMLEELRKREPNDQRTLAQLIAAYSKFDPVKAQLVSRELPAPDNIEGVDADGLESSISFLGPKYIRRTTTKADASPKPLSPKGDEGLMQKKKTKKKRKGKMPKNADPESTPDPERWLPIRERSYYRGKRKNKRKDIGKGTQGASTPASDLLDASKMGTSAPSGSAGAVGSPKSAAGTPPTSGSATPTTTPSSSLGQGPRQQKPAGKTRKKKKGGKW